MFRRAALALIAFAGLALILLTVIFGMWGKSQAIHGLVKSFGPGYQPVAMRQSQADFQTVSAMANQLQHQALPGLAATLKLTPAQFENGLATRYPAVGTGIAELPSALSWFGDLGARIGRERSNYEEAAAIPVKGLAGTTVPWLMVIPGLLLLVGAGLAALWKPSWSRGVAILGIVVGVGLVVGPLVTSLPAKATAVDQLVGTFKPILTPPGPQKTASYVTTMSAMSAQFNSRALPGLAKQLHTTTPALRQLLAARYPAVGTGLSELPSILPRFRAMSATINANIANYQKAESLPWRGAPAIMLYWFLAIPGALAALGGGAFLIWQRRPEASTVKTSAVAA